MTGLTSVRQIFEELSHEPQFTERRQAMKEQLEQLIANMFNGGILYAEAVREVKKKFILHVIRETRGNKFKAARHMGMHRNTLDRMIVELNLRDDVKQIQQGRPRRKPMMSAMAQKAMAASA